MGKRAQHAARSAAIVPAEVGGAELPELSVAVSGRDLPAVLDLPSALDLPVVRAEVPAHVVGELGEESVAAIREVSPAEPAPAAPLAVPADRPAPSFVLPVAAALGVGAAVLVGAPQLPALAVAVVWLAVAAHQAPPAMVPGLPAWRGLLSAAAAAVAASGVTVGLLSAPRELVAETLALVAVSSLSAVALRLGRRIPRRRILVVGGGADLAAAAARWLGHPDLQVVGAVLTSAPGADDVAGLDGLVESLGVPVAHDSARLGELIDHTDAELVVVCGSVDDATLRQAAWLVEGRSVGLALAGPLDAVSPHRVAVSSFAGATLTHVRSSRPSRAGALAKTALDRLVGLLLLTAVAPIMAALALWIRIDSPGPVFFRQTRVGHHGRHFTMWKLRTMVVDAERIKSTLATQNEGSGLLFKMQHDPRITASGRVLRKLSLDELPQLINVVLGTMSLVGPRPALPTEVARYDAVTRRRLASKPGITGLWQVSGRSDLSWDESVRLDLHYTDNWRIRDDAVILLRTAGAVLNARGAY